MKHALITGVSRGIGKATAERFLDEGFQVFGTSTSGQQPIQHPHFTGFQLNLAEPDQIHQVVQQLPTIDVLINNAAVLKEDYSDTLIPMDALRQTFEVNVFGTVELTEALLPKVNAGGHIVNISSAWGAFSADMFGPNVPQYKMSKAALNMYTKHLAERLRGHITVSSINPGWVKTDMGTDAAPKQPRDAADDIFYVATTPGLDTGYFWDQKQIRAW